MNTYVMLEGEIRQGVFEHSIIPVNLNNPKSVNEVILNFVEDMYEQGYPDFNREHYYQIDFDKLFEDDNLHISLIYGVGQ